MPARKTAVKAKPKPAKKLTKARAKAKSSGGDGRSATAVRADVSRARKAAKVIGKVMSSVKGGSHNEADLFAELSKLAKYIQDAKKEIAALRPEEVKEQFLPNASGELDAIVGATADATNAIMDATEIIEDVMSGLKSEPADKLMTATTAIYEACTFQDITGQRITRVVKTLQDIELKVDGLLHAFDSSSSKAKVSKTKSKPKPKKKAATKKEVTDEDLLNGPQDVGTAKSQAEIDALLASFD